MDLHSSCNIKIGLAVYDIPCLSYSSTHSLETPFSEAASGLGAASARRPAWPRFPRWWRRAAHSGGGVRPAAVVAACGLVAACGPGHGGVRPAAVVAARSGGGGVRTWARRRAAWARFSPGGGVRRAGWWWERRSSGGEGITSGREAIAVEREAVAASGVGEESYGPRGRGRRRE
jgi:hypothetical protein